MFKKAFTALTVIATVLYTVGLASFVPTAQAAESGDLIKASGDAVYYFGADGKRYVFPNERTYFTWYSDFSSVVTISDAELASYPIGGNVTMRPGVKLAKITTDPKVYAVSEGGVLRWVQTAAIAECLYGADWGSQVSDVPDPFFVNYSRGADITSCDDFDPAAATAGTQTINQDKGLTGAGPVLSGGSVNVSVAADTPASQTIPMDSSVDVAKFNLMAGSQVAQISAITLTTSGLHQATQVDNVRLQDASGNNLTSAKNVNSDSEVTFTFSTPLQISANSTMAIIVEAEYTDPNGGANGDDAFFRFGINSAADITAGGTVTGNFPVRANQMQATDSVSVGNVSLTNNGNGVSTTNSFGEDDVKLADVTLNANNEDVLLTGLRLENGGTADLTDAVSNLRLVIDGEDQATGAVSGDYVTFDVNNYFMEEGDTIIVEVYGDIEIGDAGDTIKLHIDEKGDFDFVGQEFGYGVELTTAAFGNLDTAAEALEVTLQTGDFTIDFDRAALPADEVQPDTDNVVLAVLKLTSSGEDATIEDINDANGTFEIQGTGIEAGELENVELYDPSTGGVYSVQATFNTNRYELNLEDEDISLQQAVTKTFHIRADVTDTADVDDEYRVVLAAAAMTVTGDVSDAAITDINPSSITSNTVSVKDATLELTAVALTNTTVVPNATNVVVYQGLLEAGDADGVKITSFKLSAAETTQTGVFSDNNISQLELYLDGKLLKTRSNSIDETNKEITFNSLSTVNNANVIPAGTTVPVRVVARFTGSFSVTAGALPGNFVTGVEAAGDIIARAQADNDTVTPTGTFGNPSDNTTYNTGESRDVTLAAAGNISAAVKLTNSKANQDTLTLAGAATTAGKYLAELVFTTQNEPVQVTDLRLENDSYVSTAVAATVTIPSTGGADVSVTSAATGTAGNDDSVTVAFATSGTGDCVVTAGTGTDNITVTCDDTGAAEATTAQLAAAINGEAGFSATGGDATIATGNVTAQAYNLSGGKDAGDSTFSGADVAYVNLYDGAGSLVATTAVDARGNAIFSNVDLVFEADKATSLWLGVTTKGINVENTPTATATDGRTVVYAIADLTSDLNGDAAADNVKGVVAKGVNTSQAITMTSAATRTPAMGQYSDSTQATNNTTIVGAKLVSVENAMSDGTLTGGANKTIARYTFTWDNGGNRKTDNTEMIASLEDITFTVSKTSADVDVDNADLYVQGSSGNKATATAANNGCETGDANSGTCTIRFTSSELANLVEGGDMDGAVTLVLEGDIATNTDDYLSTTLADINDSVNGGDIRYSSDGSGTITIGGAGDPQPLLGYEEVTGATLSN